MTISVRSGSLATALRTVRARGNPWDCQGFLPTKTSTSASSHSPVVWHAGRPKSWPSTQNSPVFSWARALDWYLEPKAARVARP